MEENKGVDNPEQKNPEEEASEKTSEGEFNPIESKDDLDKIVKERTDSLYAQLKKAKEKAEELEKRSDKVNDKSDEKPEKPGDVTDKEWRERVDFLIGRPDFSKEKLNFLSVTAKEKGVSLEDASELDEVKGYFGYLDQRAKDDNAVPEATSKGATFNKKPIYELDNKDIKKNWKEVLRKSVATGRKKAK